MKMTPNDKIAEAMVKRRAGQFAFLKDLVRTRTAPSPDGSIKASEKIAQMLEQLGFEVERHARSADDLGASGHPPLQNLVVRSRFGDGPTLALVSHLDTLNPCDDWSVDPFQGHIKDGTMVGIGAVSGKGHLAAQAFAIIALADIGVRPKGTIELHISFDGDSGGRYGAKWLLGEEIVQPDMVIAGGPARAVATQSTGTLVLDVDVRGLTAPAYAPGGGHDAMEAANQALTRLYQFRSALKSKASDVPGLGAPSLTVEHVVAGRTGGGVPDHATLRIDRRILPDEDATQVEKQLTRLIGSTIAKMPGTRCRIRRSVLIPAMAGGEASDFLRDAVAQQLRQRLGEDAPVSGIAFDHEGRHYAARGIPTIMYGAGPMDPLMAGMHGKDESLKLDDLRLATEVLSSAALELLDGK